MNEPLTIPSALSLLVRRQWSLAHTIRDNPGHSAQLGTDKHRLEPLRECQHLVGALATLRLRDEPLQSEQHRSRRAALGRRAVKLNPSSQHALQRLHRLLLRVHVWHSQSTKHSFAQFWRVLQSRKQAALFLAALQLLVLPRSSLREQISEQHERLAHESWRGDISEGPQEHAHPLALLELQLRLCTVAQQAGERIQRLGPYLCSRVCVQQLQQWGHQMKFEHLQLELALVLHGCSDNPSDACN
mmetsp:Transcript_41974/g.89614  ORF Transcript_41974/g.89614 Transcript_41974/m.89614 type:complete len:244 (-) Transcript_41974:628-1359(-)